MMCRLFRSGASLCVIVAVLSAVGCNSAQIAEPLTAQQIDDEMHFWHTLAERPLVSNDEAFHALLVYFEGEDPAADYAARVQTLKDRGMLTDNFNELANQAVKRGDLAVAVCRILEVKGGAVMRIFGPSRRYATRELTYLGVFPTSSEQQTFNGDEFIALLGRVEDIQRREGQVKITGRGLAVKPVLIEGETVQEADPPAEENP